MLPKALKGGLRSELLRAATKGETLSYGHLMKRFHLSRGRGVVGAIGEVDRVETERRAPGFAALVVRKDTGYPGGGFFCWDGVPPALRRHKRDGKDPRLSEAEKRYVRGLQEGIWAYYGRRAHRES